MTLPRSSLIRVDDTLYYHFIIAFHVVFAALFYVAPINIRVSVTNTGELGWRPN
ncbi:MAG: hypothetical protein KTR16_12480 [Acidiferrobacterales bacterium]|nr:hypothetical protein [Acidiferrobacterales bacterium]